MKTIRGEESQIRNNMSDSKTRLNSISQKKGDLNPIRKYGFDLNKQ